MYTSLNPGALAIQVSLTEGLALAARHGFAGYHFDLRQAAELGVGRVKDLALDQGVRLAAWGLPVEFRKDSATFEKDLGALSELARVAADLGVLRTSTWLMPYSDTLTYRKNFELHASRLGAMAKVLESHGVRLGIEYVGPKTMWASGRFPFVHTLAEALELCDASGANVGLLLDSFHWHTAHESGADLRSLSAEQIVEVHVNDAPEVPADEQQDGVRELPGATGVIDIQPFLKAIRASGYDGPVMVEPFSQRLSTLSPDAACAETRESLRAIGL